MINLTGRVNHGIFYSVLKLFTGFDIAAFIALKLTVTNATRRAATPAIKNTHQLIEILYSKFCSHLFIAHHATGNATRADIIMSFKKSLDNMLTIALTDAPSTLRIPISFVRCSAA